MTHRTERFGAEIKSAPLNFKEIAETALFSARSLLPHWLPGGRWEGEEYVAKNPTRADEHPGSFKINARSGVWSDFATGDAGRVTSGVNSTEFQRIEIRGDLAAWCGPWL